MKLNIVDLIKNIAISIIFLFATFFGLYIGIESLVDLYTGYSTSAPKLDVYYGYQGSYGAAICLGVMAFVSFYEKVFKLPIKTWLTKLVKYGFLIGLVFMIVIPIIFKIVVESKLKNEGYIRCLEFKRFNSVWAISRDQCKITNRIK